MILHLKISRLTSLNRLSGLAAPFCICALLLSTGIALGADSNNTNQLATDTNGVNGPTVQLSYDIRSAKFNPSSAFMYFVPLISPTRVDLETDADNNQVTGVISFEKNITSKSFYVNCEFEMKGGGFFKNIFNPEDVINIINKEGQDPNEPMTNALEYIMFKGEGFGRIEIRGTINGSKEIVTEVDVHFNARGHKSPVTIGLYDIKSRNGKFKYEDKYNEKIARISMLSFKKTDGDPRMGVEVDSIYKANNSNSYIGKIKAFIANFFLNPPKISKIGNETMLNFGLALLNKQSSFTFPRATNIRDYRKVTEDNISKPLNALEQKLK